MLYTVASVLTVVLCWGIFTGAIDLVKATRQTAEDRPSYSGSAAIVGGALILGFIVLMAALIVIIWVHVLGSH